MKSEKKTIGFITFNVISGGVIVVLEYALRLQRSGRFNVFLILKDASNTDFSWFDGAENLSKASYDEASQMKFDAVVATLWRTCYDLKFFNANSYIYFNQSVESKFYDRSQQNLINSAEATYLLDLDIITEATWIRDYVENNYNKNAFLVKNGVNKDNFSLQGKQEDLVSPDKLRILVEGPLEVGFKNVKKSIDLCKNVPNTDVWLLTASDVEKVDGVDRVFSRIPYNKTGEIYRSCDVLLKLSTVEGMFGPPLEMFHCGGTAVTYTVSGYDEYMVDGYNSLVAPINDDAKIIEHLRNLSQDREVLMRLKTNAVKTAAEWPSWDDAAQKFEEVLIKVIENPSTNSKVLNAKIKILDFFRNELEMKNEEVLAVRGYLGFQIHEKIRSILKKN